MGKKLGLLIISLLLCAFIVFLYTSCTTLRVGIDLLLYDLDGDTFIKNEPFVKKHLENILLAPENYMMSGYTRCVFAPEIKKTQFAYHSFYVISGKDIPSFTLSFTGTKKRMYSEGAWAINTEKDMESFARYKNGTNEWDVVEIPLNKKINIEMTLKRVIQRIDNNTNYYYRDHKKNKENMENCNTALQNTLVENN